MATPVDELIEFGGWMVDAGLVVGTGGSISLRDQDPEYIWISPACIGLTEIGRKEYVRLKLSNGEISGETKYKPASDWQVHVECLKNRKDVNAVVCCNPPLSTGLACAGLELKPITSDFVATVGNAVNIPFEVPTSSDFAQIVSDCLSESNAGLIPCHGIVVVGENVKQAFYRAQAIEHAAKTYLTALHTGNEVQLISKKQIKEIKKAESN